MFVKPLVASLCLLTTLAGCTGSSSNETTPPLIEVSRGQLFEEMGDYHRAFSTSSKEAHQYLVQGMIWYQSFNYDEAIRSFQEAARLDPECAMAWWGVSLAAGPNYINPFMDEDRNQTSWQAIQQAHSKIDNASVLERDLIEALENRYQHPFPNDRKKLDQAFADAMGKVWEKYPDDSDVGWLFAAARMILRPNQLYDNNQTPVAGTDDIIATLDRVLQLDPDHPGALHMHIHAYELSSTPERALTSADRLSVEVPASGHMLHMPCHIYIQTGQWDRAIEQSELAMKADDRYRSLSPEQFEQHLYMIHNSHLLVFSAMMAGREREAMQAARDMWEDLPEELLEPLGLLLDRWMCSVYDVQKRFGRWDELLKEPAPPKVLPITTAMWRAHRAVAYAAKQNFKAADQEYAEFLEIFNNLPLDRLMPGQTPEGLQGRLNVIRHFVPGEIALQQGKFDLAIKHLQESAEIEDGLSFAGEPPEYMQPIRHTLGAVYLKAGRFEDAERIYREDLHKFPLNGWSLFGLKRALSEQVKTADATQVNKAFIKSWSKADEPLSTSCKCIPKA
jgi:tetratricopeptide (TPR) repeat protein